MENDEVLDGKILGEGKGTLYRQMNQISPLPYRQRSLA